MQQVKNLKLAFLDNYGAAVPIRLGLTLCLLLGLLSCGKVGQFGMNAIGGNITLIQDLKSQQDGNTTVYIQGKVEKRVPLLKRYAYQINDSTGKIWVVTNQSSLREGEQVVIKGKVRYQSIPLAGKEYGEFYLEEK
ncbi:hypothetical protein [Mastigocladopsis repens]|uniref:hypothetical protein n=1 Tax=Mastigocladopsis repens TaxID=221287 RepID=UPI000309DE09|nr:hypothetical protein [Mastigocladopsis repens]